MKVGYRVLLVVALVARRVRLPGAVAGASASRLVAVVLSARADSPRTRSAGRHPPDPPGRGGQGGRERPERHDGRPQARARRRADHDVARRAQGRPHLRPASRSGAELEAVRPVEEPVSDVGERTAGRRRAERPRAHLRAARAASRSRVRRRPIARDDPQPHRPIRGAGAGHPTQRQRRHPRPAPGHPGSAACEGLDRQDRGAGVQAGERGGCRSDQAAAERHRDRLRPGARLGDGPGQSQDPVRPGAQDADDGRGDRRRARAAVDAARGPVRRGDVEQSRGEALRPAHDGERRPSARDRARQHRVLGAGDSRADRRRARIDHRQFRHQRGAGSRDRVACRRLAGSGGARRGAHGRADARPRLDPPRHALVRRRRVARGRCSWSSTTAAPA